jgi:hypothetical protein
MIRVIEVRVAACQKLSHFPTNKLCHLCHCVIHAIPVCDECEAPFSRLFYHVICPVVVCCFRIPLLLVVCDLPFMLGVGRSPSTLRWGR